MLVVYHASCFDGLSSALVVQWAYKDSEETITYAPWDYTHPMTLPTYEPGETIYVVDFSFSGHELCTHFANAGKVMVIDHHQGAIDQLLEYFKDRNLPANIELLLNPNYSGAGLTWKHFFGTAPLPDLIKHVQDRDLWKFELPGTREYVERLSIEPMTLEAYDLFTKEDYQTLLEDGSLLIRKMQAQVQYHLDHSLTLVEFGGYKVPLLNVPRYLTSEVGNALAGEYPFVLLYFDVGNLRHWSLRSQKGPKWVNVAKIAQRYNGNGHPTAAGFKTSVTDEVVKYLS